ncbi:MAG TPA: alkaline phosphatase family protein [Candidatus Tumulicola sp.]|jgi:phospholipase C
MILNYRRIAAFVCSLAVLAACSGGAASQIAPSFQPARRNATSQSIQHIVMIVQENRSFDNLFSTFPNADGQTYGYYLKNKKPTKIALKELPLNGGLDINHDSRAYNYACDGKDTYPKTSCTMDSFNLEGIDGNNPAGTYPYQYINPKDIKQYWSLAKNFGLADHMFQTQGSGSFTAHQDLVAGGTMIDDAACSSTKTYQPRAVIDYPSNFTNWGCGAAAGTTTSLLTQQGQYLLNGGPFPCLSYPTPTIVDLMDAKSVTWKYYAPPYDNFTKTDNGLWNAMAALKEVYSGPEWTTNVSMPECNVFSDISGGTLPQVSWVIPEGQDSDHPGGKGTIDYGPRWVGAVVDAIGKSKYWSSTAIILTWDDWGGFYDHEKPAFFDTMGGLGFRVPMVVISPYVPKGEVSDTQYEFGSIMKFVEDTFALGSMGTTDMRATSIGNMFDMTQRPRKFVKVAAPPSNTFCTSEKALREPVDRE